MIISFPSLLLFLVECSRLQLVSNSFSLLSSALFTIGQIYERILGAFDDTKSF